MVWKIVPLVLAVGLAWCFPDSGALQAQDKPNIILINLDDADLAMLSDGRSRTRFPEITALAQRGIRFTNLHVTTPLCGPSRACLLRGQYAHNTGIRVNDPNSPNANGMTGGMRFYEEQGYFEDDISVWMKNAGYRTMMVGKFLHSEFVATIPTGWDDFYFYVGGKYFDFLRYSNRKAGGVWDRFPAEVYRTVAESDDAVSLIQSHVDRGTSQPFFLYLCPLGPHRQQAGSPGMVDGEQYGNLWPTAAVPWTPAFNEFDFSDKRGSYRELSSISNGWQQYIGGHYRDRLLATKSVDDLVGEVVAKVSELGLEDNTYIFLTSDNGFSLGYNRWFGKGSHLNRVSNVPLMVAGPGVSSGKRADHLLAHIDITPTILELAGADIPGVVDGKSFRSLLASPGSYSVEDWQTGVLVELWSTRTPIGRETFSATNSLRLPNAVYTEYANGEHEYYDFADDPHQLENGFDELSEAAKIALAIEIRSLKNVDSLATARFTVPSVKDEVFEGGVRLSGLAEDSMGIEEVKLAIVDLESGRYWNGMQWSEGFVQTRAELQNRGGLLSHWSYLFEPGLDGLPSGSIGVWVWGFDKNREFGSPDRRVFKLQFGLPTASVVFPGDRDQLQSPIHFRGEAIATAGVDHVQLVVRNASRATYWDGSELVEEWNVIDITPDADGQWRFSADLPAGRYNVAVFAVDHVGVRANEAGRQLFYVK